MKISGFFVHEPLKSISVIVKKTEVNRFEINIFWSIIFNESGSSPIAEDLLFDRLMFSPQDVRNKVNKTTENCNPVFHK